MTNAKSLKTSHVDRKNMENIRLLAIINVPSCKISPGNMKSLPVLVRVYQMSSRTNVLATKCRSVVMANRFNCGKYSHSLFHNRATLTYLMMFDPDKCKKAVKFAAKIGENNHFLPYFNTSTKQKTDSPIFGDKQDHIKQFLVDTIMMKRNLCEVPEEGIPNTKGQVLSGGL